MHAVPVRALAAASEREQTARGEQRASAPYRRPNGSLCTGSLDADEPGDAGEEQDAGDVEVQAQPEDVVGRVDARGRGTSAALAQAAIAELRARGAGVIHNLVCKEDEEAQAFERDMVCLSLYERS